MANQTLGVNIHQINPYQITVTNSGTLIGSDIELVINLSTVKTKEDVMLALEYAFETFFSQSIGPGAIGTGAAPP